MELSSQFWRELHKKVQRRDCHEQSSQGKTFVAISKNPSREHLESLPDFLGGAKIKDVCRAKLWRQSPKTLAGTPRISVQFFSHG